MNADPIARQLGHLRRKARRSQSEVAEMLGVVGPCISHWESGNRTMPLPRVRQYAALFGLELALIAPPEPGHPR